MIQGDCNLGQLGRNLKVGIVGNNWRVGNILFHLSRNSGIKASQCLVMTPNSSYGNYLRNTLNVFATSQIQDFMRCREVIILDSTNDFFHEKFGILHDLLYRDIMIISFISDLEIKSIQDKLGHYTIVRSGVSSHNKLYSIVVSVISRPLSNKQFNLLSKIMEGLGRHVLLESETQLANFSAFVDKITQEVEVMTADFENSLRRQGKYMKYKSIQKSIHSILASLYAREFKE